MIPTEAHFSTEVSDKYMFHSTDTIRNGLYDGANWYGHVTCFHMHFQIKMCIVVQGDGQSVKYVGQAGFLWEAWHLCKSHTALYVTLNIYKLDIYSSLNNSEPT